MMTKYKLIFIASLTILLLSSCGALYESSKERAASLTPDIVRMNIDINQLEPLGEQKISVEYRTYLGFITDLDSINHVAYDRRNVNKVILQGPKDFTVPRYLNRAIYKVTERFPNADYYIPMYTSRKINRMFLGRKTQQSMIIRAYKLK